MHFLGKAATFCLLIGFPLLLLGAAATGTGISVAEVARAVGWAFAIWGTGAVLVGRAALPGPGPSDPAYADRPESPPRRPVALQRLGGRQYAHGAAREA